MDTKNAPAITAEGRTERHKGMPKLPRLQAKVFEMLCNGRYSASDISARLRVADPRGHIRELRLKGINVQDEWCAGLGNVRYKRYWIVKRR